jgi:hypothetical protein
VLDPESGELTESASGCRASGSATGRPVDISQFVDRFRTTPRAQAAFPLFCEVVGTGADVSSYGPSLLGLLTSPADTGGNTAGQLPAGERRRRG